MYFTDTVTQCIYNFDYQQLTGEITNQRILLKTSKTSGIGPDGLTVDNDGHIWSAQYGGSAIYRYAANGKQKCRIELPTAKNVTSLIFAGDTYTDIYITTGGSQDRGDNGKDAGALFRLRSQISGNPEFQSKIGI
jgi:sugar lactone lactonase YvrE